jgi:hypothetical protein
VLIDRHIVKNGGTTFRGLLQSNKRLGRCAKSTLHRHEQEREAYLYRPCDPQPLACVRRAYHFASERFWHTVAALKQLYLSQRSQRRAAAPGYS